jgi:transketolase
MCDSSHEKPPAQQDTDLLLLPPPALQAVTKGAKSEEQWKKDCQEYAKKYPKEYAEFEGQISGAQ